MDMTQLQGTIGAATGTAAGQSHAVRTNRAGAFMNAPISASFQEAVLRGRCYTICNVAGITTQAGLSATNPALTLYNPAGSGVNGVIWFAGVSFNVVFAAVSTVYVAAGTNPNAAAVTGTLTTTHRNCLLGASNNPSIIPMLAATLPAAPVAVAILGHGLTGAVNLLPNTHIMGQWFNGGLILAPGCNLSIQTSAASGASGTWCQYIWEEIEI
jgi:hypothetical protein